LGMVPESYRGYAPLDLPDDWKTFANKKNDDISPMKAIGIYFEEVIKRNPTTFRIFSPDELASNKLNSVFNLTNRNFQWDPETANRGGRVIEMLSEHTLQGFLQGYSMTGRYGVLPSYEAFLSIVDTMIIQFSKFIKVALETKWRGDVPSLTYIETSTLWRQEHNGYSHQHPGLINTLLCLPRNIVRVYLPPDGNTAISSIAHCLRSKNYVNLIVGSKQPGPNWLTPEEADRHCIAGVSVWKQYSTHDGMNPDVVLCGIGNEMTTETIHAAALLKKDAPNLRIRVVNVNDLLVLGESGEHPHSLDRDSFNSIFTSDKPVVITFHGYPAVIRQLVFDRNHLLGEQTRFTVLGYLEEGTTTTPFSMLRLNKCGRWDIGQAALKAISRHDPPRVDTIAHELISFYQHANREHEKYVLEHGEDPSFLGGPPQFEA